MKNRIRRRIEESAQHDARQAKPQPIGEVLAELLNQYQRQYPDLKVTLVETAASAV